MFDEVVASKRHDPDFSQVSGYIPKELFLQFKAQCTIAEVTISEALEQMIQEWLQKQQKAKK